MTQVKMFHLDREQMHTAFAYAVDDIIREARFHVAGLIRDRCWHRHLSWPMHDVQHCFDCAGSWRYDSQRMQRSGRLPILPRARKGNVLSWPNTQPGGVARHPYSGRSLSLAVPEFAPRQRTPAGARSVSELPRPESQAPVRRAG